jgi:serine/threonine-protein kinase
VSEGEKDKVFSQEPAANSQARKQSVVKLTMSAGPGRTAIADVQAFSPEDSKKTLEALKLTVTTSAQKIQNRDIPEGLVVRTNPPAATQVDVGSSVELVLSDGPPPKPLPPLTGEYTEVSKQLVAAGFAVQSPPKNTRTTTDSVKGTVAGCTVIDTNKPCAPREKEGIVVQLAVFVMDAKGGVPNVLKLTQAAALAELKDAGLTLGSVTKKPSATAALGTVIETKPAAGVQSNLGIPVDIVVSGGPPVTVPSVSGLTVQVAKDRLVQAGLVGVTSGCTTIDKVTNLIPAIGTQVSRGDSISIGCSRCSLTICVDVKAAVQRDATVLRLN